MPKNKLSEKVRDALQDLLDSEDDTGCSDDLTVVSKKAVDTLRDLLTDSNEFKE